LENRGIGAAPPPVPSSFLNSKQNLLKIVENDNNQKSKFNVEIQ
jgi:hypothetical protein